MRSKQLLIIFLGAGIYFLLECGCTSPKQKMLEKKWTLSAVGMTTQMNSEDSLSNDTPKKRYDIVKMPENNFMDLTDPNEYISQLMEDKTDGSYKFIELTNRIIRHNTKTNITDTIEVQKLTADSLVLYEPGNMLTLFLTAGK